MRTRQHRHAYPLRVKAWHPAHSSVNIPITADVFHEYRLLSWDMHAYELYIGGELARVGSFWDGLLSSKFAWGDGVSGAASLAHWDYVQFGVVPEPCAVWLFAAGLAACALRTVRAGMHTH